MQNTEEIARLIKKQLDGNITVKEKLKLEHWVERNPEGKALLMDTLQDDALWEDVLLWLDLENQDGEKWESRLEKNVAAKIFSSSIEPKPVRMGRKIMRYAAVFLLLAVAGSVYYYQVAKEEYTVIADIAPAGNKATLTTAEGHTIELKGDKKGIVFGQDLTYNDGTLLVSAGGSNDDRDEQDGFFVLATSKGSQYQVTLPDGTKVWLNAASKLTYPITFSKESRVVELEGEAYFEVAQVYEKGDRKNNSSRRIPFLIRTAKQEIEVLGTQFNVSAYADEPETKTTLVEGAVRLTSTNQVIELSPGEQGVTNKTSLTKSKVDAYEALAWRDNKFLFNETELRDAMSQLSRWYDVQILYSESIPTIYLYGEISRSKTLQEVLKIIEVGGGVRFNIESVDGQNRLSVLP